MGWFVRNRFMTNPLWDRETFVEKLRAVGGRAYHDKHPFHVAMNEGLLLPEAVRGWVAVRFAVDAYVNFARNQPWPIAIASSLTELFAPDLMSARLTAFERFYSWIDARGLDYFRRRVTQARRDSDEALGITLEYCNTPEL